ncbi:MAG: sensor histidine kinase NtrY-like [Rhodospirillales bacterium]
MITKTFHLLGLTGRRASIGRRVAVLLALAALCTSAATGVVFVQGGGSITTVLALLQVNIAVLLVLAVVVVLRLTALWRAHRRRAAGSRLHANLILMFGLVAVTPALLVAVLAAAFLNYGFQGWFSDRIKTAVEQSNSVAQAYLDEHVQNIRSVASAVAADADANASRLIGADKNQIEGFLTAQSDVRGLAEAVLLDGNGRIIARSAFSQSFDFDQVDPVSLETARRTGEIVVSTGRSDDRVRAVVSLNRFIDAYLVVGRLIDTSVLESVQRVEGAVSRYSALETERIGVEVTFSTIFAVVALLALLAAVWMGLIMAARLTEPIRSVADAAQRMGEGDLEARAEVGGLGELATLGAAFNGMAEKISVQQSGLMDANSELDERRQFIETVLGGVTAGVIGLDAEGRIRFPNRSASVLLGVSLEAETGRALGDVVPEMADLPKMLAARPESPRELEIKLFRGGAVKTFLVRIAGERVGDLVIGYVITFDDITELQSAQRKAAWADVARRIAHEIKNPLTPIQLSAERLRRRFMDSVGEGEDRETFEQCVNTITRQVGEIGAMVDEFSAFARMPQADIKPHDVAALCREAAFMERNRSAGVKIELDIPPEPLAADCDQAQISRALVNLLKNASESIEAAHRSGETGETGEAGEAGRITLSTSLADGPGGAPWVRLSVADTGPGLPKRDRDRLIEPYVTNRQKGTGLGLAIVKKIAEDHGGTLTLGDRPGGGADVVIAFPARRAGAHGGAAAAAENQNQNRRAAAK